MTVKPVAAMDTIRRETVEFLKTTLQNYCDQNGVVIMTLSGRPGFPNRKRPTNELHCTLLTRERCSWQYPGLEEKGHFYSGVMMVVREAPDEHGPNYVEVVFVPEHDDPQGTNSFPALDLTLIQEELTTREKWPGIIRPIEERLRTAMEAEESLLAQYKKK